MNRYFIFLYIEDSRLKDLVNYAIFCLNPTEKWPAHVTIAGPYLDKRDLPAEEDLRFEHRLSILGAGQFRGPNQNTVFLRVEGRALESVWEKADYPYSPHLTLYDGDDPVLADELYRWAKNERMIFQFVVTRRVVVSAEKNQGAFNLLSEFNPGAFARKNLLTFEEISKLDRPQRFALATSALKRAKIRGMRA